MTGLDDEFAEEMRKLETKRPKHPDQAKKLIYLFCKRTGHRVSTGSKVAITKQAELGSALGLDSTRMNKAYWGVESLQLNQIKTLATIYSFDPQSFQLPADEFILSLGGWSIKWDQAIELAELVKDPIHLIKIRNEIKTQKKLRLSRFQNQDLDTTQKVAPNTPFQWKLNCNSLFPNAVDHTEIHNCQAFAFEYDSRSEMVQFATQTPQNMIANACEFFTKEKNELWWTFPKPHSKDFPHFPEEDVKRTIEIILFVFRDGGIDDDLKVGLLSSTSLKVSDPIMRRFSSTFYAAATKRERKAAAVRSRVRVDSI